MQIVPTCRRGTESIEHTQPAVIVLWIAPPSGGGREKQSATRERKERGEMEM